MVPISEAGVAAVGVPGVDEAEEEKGSEGRVGVRRGKSEKVWCVDWTAYQSEGREVRLGVGRQGG